MKIKTQAGLTLIELMVTLAVAIALLAVGVPLFNTISANSKAVSQANALVGAFNLARSEAITRSATVSVCPVVSATASPVVCAATTASWVNGWMVFADVDGDGVVDSADGDTRIRVWQPFNPAPTITPNIATVQFLDDGAVASEVKVTISQDASDSTRTRCVGVLASGQIGVDKGDC